MKDLITNSVGKRLGNLKFFLLDLMIKDLSGVEQRCSSTLADALLDVDCVKGLFNENEMNFLTCLNSKESNEVNAIVPPGTTQALSHLLSST